LSLKTYAHKAETKKVNSTVQASNLSLLSRYSAVNSLHAIWNTAIELQATVAIWRKPRSNEFNILIDFSPQLQPTSLDIDGGASGFAVSPFQTPGGQNVFLLQPHLHISLHDDGPIILSDTETPDAYWRTLGIHLNNAKQGFETHTGQQPNSKACTGKFHFLKCVNKALKLITSGSIEKVVIARAFSQPLSNRFDLMTLLSRLSTKHPDAFISLISIPKIGTWMGASPELLMAVNATQQFRTVSLAGTQAYPIDHPLSEAVWKQKEIEEQAMVSRFIITQFKSIGLKEFHETGPRSVRAGSLIHLKSEFHVDMQATSHSKLSNTVLQSLHPTSAICGMPRHAAQEFISSNEGFNRGLYGGFLGPININKESQLYVNLRCIQLSHSHVTYYAGAGITHASIAEKEWQEIQLKSNMLQALVNEHKSNH
jgi:isochorismate synthase